MNANCGNAGLSWGCDNSQAGSSGIASGFGTKPVVMVRLAAETADVGVHSDLVNSKLCLASLKSSLRVSSNLGIKAGSLGLVPKISLF